MSSASGHTAATPLEPASWSLLLIPVILCLAMVIASVVLDSAAAPSPASDQQGSCRPVDYRSDYCDS